MSPAEWPIPQRLNLLIAGSVFGAAIALLWAGSRLPWAGTIVAGVLFSFVLLTLYALLHEAAHDMLHGDPRINRALATVLGWLFPISFTVLRTTHIVHHCCNRTDHEMFDCYYPGDSRIVKTLQWYGLLLGLWWPLIPLGCVLLATAPGLLRRTPFRRARSTAVLFDDFGSAEIRRIRLECLAGLGLWAALFGALRLDWRAVLILYACFAFNWSTRQYVTHAFTPRRVRTGALNLRLGRIMGWVLLNGHWDRVHHEQPHLPWIHLAEQGRRSQAPVSYWRQYLRLWRGPRLCTEPGPSVLARQAYEAL